LIQIAWIQGRGLFFSERSEKRKTPMDGFTAVLKRTKDEGTVAVPEDAGY
jgi:hypothetical protein